MRQFRWIAWIVAVAFMAAPQAMAQTWPSQPIKIIVGFGPGSTPDLMGRVIAEQLQAALGQPVVVENKPGAGGNIAAGDVAKAAADGYTLGVTIPGPLIVNPMIGDVSYDPKKDLKPITILGTQPSVLVVPAGLGVNNIAELVALLKKNPGKYNYASIGIGSISHLSMELLAQQSGTEMVHVPYKSSPEALTAVATGDAQMAALAPAAVLGMAQAGKVKMLAVTTPKRWPAIPDVPTFAESGLPEVQAEAWMALIAPANVPAPVIDRIYGEVKTALGKPDALEKMKKLNFEPVGITPAQFAARINEEEKRWGTVVEKLGMKKK
jgi:tripartite-type tricarboxylate transporter receptor subunit TctC